MSRLSIETPDRAQTVLGGLNRDMERRINASPHGLCPVDMSLNFLRLCHAQTCGKCVPCRIGLSPLTVPIGAVPISLANFVICLTAWLLGPKFGTLSVVIYLALGAIGIPVFSGYGAGLAKLAGPTGGYLVGYLLLAFIGGMFIEKSKGNPVVSAVGLVLGDAACYVLGTAWFVFQMQCELGYALTVCVYPFIALDLGKIVVSCIVGALLRKRLTQAGVLKLQNAVSE